MRHAKYILIKLVYILHILLYDYSLVRIVENILIHKIYASIPIYVKYHYVDRVILR